MKLLRCLLFFLLFPAGHCAAQEPATAAWAGTGFGINYFGGRVLKHNKRFTLPIPAYTQGIELSLVQQTYGRKDWERRRGCPQWGAGLMLLSYGIDSIYGKMIAIYPHLQFPLISGRRLSWTMRFGAGVGLVSRHFERAPVWDTLNKAIGSTLNNFTILTTDLRYRVSDHLEIQAGGNFSHMSNGAFRFPNLGVNVYGAHVGVRYFPVTAQPKIIAGAAPHLPNRFTGGLRLGFAMQEAGLADGPAYPVYLASGYAAYRYRGKNKVMIGLDAADYPRIYSYERNNEFNQGHEHAGAWKGAVFAGHEWLYGHASLYLQLGYYYHQAYLKNAPVYQKLGACYYLMRREQGTLKDVFLYGMLKSHFATAELCELGLGIGF